MIWLLLDKRSFLVKVNVHSVIRLVQVSQRVVLTFAGIGAKLAPEFIYESLTDPQAYIYLDFRHDQLPEEYPARMPYINKNPIALSKPEIYSVIAFLQKMSGEPISIKVEDIMSPEQDQEEVKVAVHAGKSTDSSVVVAQAASQGFE